MADIADVFPCRLYMGKIKNHFEILKEIDEKLNDITIVSRNTQIQSSEDYLTDYNSPISLRSFEDCIHDFFLELRQDLGLDVELIKYWTAIYTKSGNHSIHTHRENIISANNYSGVLYLSSGQGTTLFSSNPSSFDSEVQVYSEIGDIILFPSSLPHCYYPKNITENKRTIISFNVNIRGV